MSEIDDLSRALITQTSRVFRYKDAARANVRGFARLHRKVDKRDKRIADLIAFIDQHQLTQALAEVEGRSAAASKAAWAKREVRLDHPVYGVACDKVKASLCDSQVGHQGM